MWKVHYIAGWLPEARLRDIYSNGLQGANKDDMRPRCDVRRMGPGLETSVLIDRPVELHQLRLKL